jgi:hypothetical protein
VTDELVQKKHFNTGMTMVDDKTEMEPAASLVNCEL